MLRAWLMRTEGMTPDDATTHVAERWPHLGLWNASFTAALAASQLIPGLGGLLLDRHGFSMKVAFFNRRHLWSEITPVEASSAGLFQLVGYRLVGEPLTKPREVLPETYGLGAFELARVMNYWRDRALGTEPSAPAPLGPEAIFEPEEAVT